MSKRRAERDETTPTASDREAGKKRLHTDRSYTQLELKSFFSASSSQAPFETVRKCGIKIYTVSEIHDAGSEMEHKFRIFWNDKAEEICGSKATMALLKTKQSIQGAIHSAWIIRKTDYLLIEVDHLRQVATDVYKDKVIEKLKSIECNAERMSKASSAVASLYSKLTPQSSYADRMQVGESIHKAMEELQEALRKAIQRLRNAVLKAVVKEEKAFTMPGCSKITDEELSSVVEDVKDSPEACNKIPGINEYDSD